MPPSFKGKNRIKIVGEIRRSQMITTFGSGALVDFPRLSGIVSGIDSWKTQYLSEEAKIRERNLEKLLGVDSFYQVSSDMKKSISSTFNIPIFRFPGWYYCPECHRLDYYKNISKSTSSNTSEYNSALYCDKCSDKHHKVKLIPSRFIIGCVNGHIDDFPYDWWVHRGKEKCEHPKLKLEYKGTSGGLDSIEISCESCNAKTTMAGCMKEDALKGYKCRKLMPWLGFDDTKRFWYTDPDECNAIPRTLQRSANNVYYPVNKSALTVPPWSEKLQTIFSQNESLFRDIFDDDPEEILYNLKRQFKKKPELYGENFEAFKEAAYRRYGDMEETVTEESLILDEYQAFVGEDIHDEEFRTETVEVPGTLKRYIKNIKLVKKIREVLVLQGFTRILPSRPTDPSEVERLGLSNREFSPISRKPLNWLPAIELFGEGIFIELDEQALHNWESANNTRYEALETRMKNVPFLAQKIKGDIPRYVLLHTLSHLLIRQLTAQCGYATASIKEKIYSTNGNNDNKMSGILIYTAATCTDGSLGGLVREGQTKNIKEIFENMLEESSWCSNDPLCIESHTQGYNGMNYAACHACTLLPETSCESFNCLLDRASVVGEPGDRSIGFFGELM